MDTPDRSPSRNRNDDNGSHRRSDCDHVVRRVTRDVSLAACGACGTVAWFRGSDRVDAFDGMAEVFGMFDHVATLPGVAAPGRDVMLYRAPRGASRDLLGALPLRAWVVAAPGIAVSHDGRHLLVSPLEPAEARPAG